jgi:LPS sulfotransferase NodH
MADRYGDNSMSLGKVYEWVKRMKGRFMSAVKEANSWRSWTRNVLTLTNGSISIYGTTDEEEEEEEEE